MLDLLRIAVSLTTRSRHDLASTSAIGTGPQRRRRNLHPISSSTVEQVGVADSLVATLKFGIPHVTLERGILLVALAIEDVAIEDAVTGILLGPVRCLDRLTLVTNSLTLLG